VLIDTHCHIHWTDYGLDVKEVIKHAHDNGVTKMICVGTDEDTSKLAIEFAKKHQGVYSAVGIHPHYASSGLGKLEDLIKQNLTSIVAIGEIGLDYYRNQSPKVDQIKLLRQQIKLALKYNLPIIFHVREAFDDFWPIFDEFISAGRHIRGVLHSFTDSAENLQKGLDRGLYIGINGYSTFTKDETQKAMFSSVPVSKIVFETDAPFLTPAPFRGKMVNEPAYVRNVAEYHGEIHNLGLDEISAITTENARELFNL
jgi:TatD DNase family protein